MESLTTGERKIVADGYYARYAPTGPVGHLVYAREETLYAIPFDPERLETRGSEVAVLTNVWALHGVDQWGYAQFAFSETGTLVFRRRATADRRLFLVDLDGTGEEPLAAPALTWRSVRFAPDGERLVLMTAEQKVHVFEIQHGRLSLVTSGFEDPSGTFWTPVERAIWSPDGKHLAVNATSPGQSPNLFLIAVDTKDVSGPLLERSATPVPWDFSPDGERLLFRSRHPVDEGDIWQIALEDPSVPIPVVRGAGDQIQPSLSSDGRWLAYASNEFGLTGRYEVYVMPLDGSSGGQQVSLDGGREPVWSPDGRQIYYRSGDRMLAVAVTTEPTFTAETPRLLFDLVNQPSDRALGCTTSHPTAGDS